MRRRPLCARCANSAPTRPRTDRLPAASYTARMSIPLDERGLPPGYPFNPDWEITPRDAKSLLDSGPGVGAVLLDCRRPDEWAVSRIEGAILAPLHELPSRVNELGEYSDRPVVVHCRSGKRSLQATDILRKAGFDNVRSMAGGIELWNADPALGGRR